MENEVVTRLDLIADLLKQRLELEKRREESRELERAEALERFRDFKLEMPKLELPKAESPNEFYTRLEQANERERAERRAFEAALLAELRRQSDAIERLIDAKR